MTQILIVEDEGIIAKDLQRSLQRMGYDALEPVGRGEDAVRTAIDRHPDLVLMDIHLAGAMDGTEAALQIMRSTGAAIVFLTAYADDETLQKAQESAPYGYLVKPFDDETLRTTISTALHKRAADARHERRLRIQQEALDRLDQGVLVAGADGKIRYSNMAAQRLLGPHDSDAVLHGRDDAAALWRTLMSTRGQPVEWAIEGRQTTFSAHPVDDEFLVVISSSGAAQAHESAANKALQELQKRVRELI